LFKAPESLTSVRWDGLKFTCGLPKEEQQWAILLDLLKTGRIFEYLKPPGVLGYSDWSPITTIICI